MWFSVNKTAVTLSFRLKWFGCSLYFQTRLPWWPKIEIVYNKSSELRLMFTECLTKVTQITGHTSHKGAHVSTSLDRPGVLLG